MIQYHLLFAFLFLGVLLPLRAVPIKLGSCELENNEPRSLSEAGRAAIESARMDGREDASATENIAALIERADTAAIGEKRTAEQQTLLMALPSSSEGDNNNDMGYIPSSGIPCYDSGSQNEQRQVSVAGQAAIERAEKGVRHPSSTAITEMTLVLSSAGTSHRQITLTPASGEISSSSPFSAQRMTQVPLPAERADQALEELQHDNKIAQQFLNDLDQLVTLIKAQKTSVCLNAINAIALSPEVEPFYANNRGENVQAMRWILNDAVSPLSVAVPSSGGSSSITYVTPPIIPAGANLFVKDVNGAYVLREAPTTEQTPEQNQAVRKLIKESFKASYGSENADAWLSDIDAPENRDKPITIGDLSAAFGNAAEWIENENVPPKINISKHLPDIPTSVGEFLANKHVKSNETQRQEARQLFNRVRNNLTAPEEALIQALQYSAQTAAHSAAVVGGAVIAAGAGATVGGIAGIAGGAAAFGASGAVSGAAFGAVLGATHAFSGGIAGGAVFGATQGAYSFGVIGAPLMGVSGAWSAANWASDVILPPINEFFSPSHDAAQKAKEAFYRWNGKDTADALASIKKAQVTDQAAIESLNSFFDQLPESLNNANVLPPSAENSLSAAAAEEDAISVVEPASISAATVASAEENAGDQPNRVMSIADIRTILIGQIEKRIGFRNNLISTLENKIASLEEARKNITSYDRVNKKMTSPWSSHAARF